MSCQRVLSMISAYIDGEVQAADAEMVKQHLETCASCAHEFEMLQRTSCLLADADELAPPAFLLEQIEAATVNRPSISKRLRAAFQPPRLAVAGTVAAVALIGMIVFQTGVRQVVESPVVTTEPSPTVTVVAEPVLEVSLDEVIPDAAVSVTAVSETPSQRVRAAVIGKTRTTPKALPASPAVKETVPARESEQATAKLPADSEASTGLEDGDHAMAVGLPDQFEPSDSGAVAVEQAQPEDSTIRVLARTVTDLETKIRQQTDILEDLRTRIAAKNRQRKYETNLERIEGRKHSVELASIQF